MASTKERILGIVDGLPKDQDGWVEYSLDPIAKQITDKARNNLSVQVSELVRDGQLEAKREGRFIKHVRLAQVHTLEQIKNSSGSQTERMLHYLFGLADEKGVIRGDALDIRHLQKALGFRDFHDTNKALHNLNKLGILEIRQTRLGSGQNHRITRMRLRVEHQKSWLIDLLSDEELPGNTDIEYEGDEMREGELTPTIEESRDGLTARTEVVGLGAAEMEIMSEELEPVEQIGTTVDRVPFTERFPLVADRVRLYRLRLHALKALDEAGEEELAEMLREKLVDPLDRELMRLAIECSFYG